MSPIEPSNAMETIAFLYTKKGVWEGNFYGDNSSGAIHTFHMLRMHMHRYFY